MNPILQFAPKIDPEAPAWLRQHLTLIYQKLNNHTQAVSLLAKKTSGTTVNTTNEFVTTTSGGGGGGGGGGSTSTVGLVSNQSGQTAYSTQAGDNAALIVLSDASPIAVTLTTQSPPWCAFFANQGAGLATLTPASGTISYAGNPGAGFMPLPSGYSCLVAFDGTNWWAWTEPIVPVNTPAVTHQWLSAYNATTGAFTQTQPSYGDISGTPVLPLTISPIANQFLTGYNATTGTFSQALAVASFNTRTGAVVPTTGDYTAAQVTNALDLSNTGTQTMAGTLAITGTGKSLNVATIKDASGTTAATLASGGFSFPVFIRANGGITSSGYFVSGTAPTVAAQAGAGTGATASVSANSSNGCGVITLNAQATGGAAGAWVTVTFAGSPFGAAPRVVITNGNSNVTGAIHYVTSTTSSFTISCTAAPATLTYVWNYFVIG